MLCYELRSFEVPTHQASGRSKSPFRRFRNRSKPKVVAVNQVMLMVALSGLSVSSDLSMFTCLKSDSIVRQSSSLTEIITAQADLSAFPIIFLAQAEALSFLEPSSDVRQPEGSRPSII